MTEDLFAWDQLAGSDRVPIFTHHPLGKKSLHYCVLADQGDDTVERLNGFEGLYSLCAAKSRVFVFAVTLTQMTNSRLDPTNNQSEQAIRAPLESGLGKGAI